jgi:hypothetical protein
MGTGAGAEAHHSHSGQDGTRLHQDDSAHVVAGDLDSNQHPSECFAVFTRTRAFQVLREGTR